MIVYTMTKGIDIMEKLQELIQGLNEDLANEYGAMIQYTYSASVVSGLYRSALKPFFESEIADEQGHALYLSEKIKSLGGTPTTTAVAPPQPTDVTDLLKAVLKAETETIERYEERKKLAEELKMTELVVQLEDMISDETHHKEEIERLLQDPRLAS